MRRRFRTGPPRLQSAIIIATTLKPILASQYDTASPCHSLIQWPALCKAVLKKDGWGCVYRSDVSSDHGQKTSNRICYAMPESKKKKKKNEGKKMDNDHADKKVIGHLSSPLKNQMDILQTISLWPMSNMDVHTCKYNLWSLVLVVGKGCYSCCLYSKTAHSNFLINDVWKSRGEHSVSTLKHCLTAASPRSRTWLDKRVSARWG